MNSNAPARLHYPNRAQTSDIAFTKEKFTLVASHILSWKQGPGNFGGIHLHACWGESSALARGYHGSTTWASAVFLQGVVSVARKRNCPWWTHLADTTAAQLLSQLTPDGGFIHASAEFEPTYTREESCPIHQMLPMLALLDYCASAAKGAPLPALIQEALPQHIAWFAKHWWKRGNACRSPLPYDGWCGVTNQDLVAICALARYGEVFHDWVPYQEYGLPALETYLGPIYYHKETGLFERGDKSTLFTERCSYMNIIADMLHRIHSIRPDNRIPEILSRIGNLLVDAIYIDKNGCYQMATGANDAKTNESGAIVWLKDKVQISDYPEFLITLQSFSDHTSPVVKEKFEGLKTSLANYLFSDGGIPSALDTTNTLFNAVPSLYALVKLWSYFSSIYPDGFNPSDLPVLPSVRRRSGNIIFTSTAKFWEIKENDQVIFRGIKELSHGVLGPDEELSNLKFPSFDEIEVEEEL